MKRAFKYRFYPTDAQAAELSRTFGCVRKVYNLALAARTQAWTRQERVNYNQTPAMLTVWPRTEELAFLNEVSSVPLQQTLRHFQAAFTNFFGGRAGVPSFPCGHDFTAPDSRSRLQNRWTTRKSAMSGTMASSAPVITSV
jgi:putative transposase